jgi:serine/threonine protein kinase
LHDIGHQDGIDYLVMECVEGETLAKRLEKGPLPVDQVLNVGAQIADALDKAHHSGIVHRDVKPNNIVLTPTGAKLLDFGLAKPASALVDVATMTATKVETPVTERGTIVGTFQYMSPEQVEGRELDGRSDIFSLGTVLYEMVTGHHAFEGKSRLSVASAILEKEPAPITTIKPLAPTALDHTIRTCLAKDPNDRWQTARDLSHELKWIAESSSQAGAPAVADRTSRFTRERIGWATAAVLLLGALAAMSIAYFKTNDPPALVVRSAIPSPPNNPFTPAGSMTWHPAISPDGTQIVVPLQANNGKNALWLRILKTGEGRVLPGTEDGTSPFWSPDSRSIGFFTLDGRLKRIDIDGNSVQDLAPSSASGSRGAAWSPNGVILFCPGSGSSLYEIPASGGTPKQLTELNVGRKEQSHRWPVFLSDGKRFLFFIRSEQQPEISGIYAGSLDSKEYRLVVKATAGPAFAIGGTLVYMRNGTLLTQAFDERTLTVSGEPTALPDHVGFNAMSTSALFSISSAGEMVYFPTAAAGPMALSWFDRNGKLTESIDPGGYIYALGLSPDGTHAAVSMMSPDGLSSNLWNFDLARGTRPRLTSGPEQKYAPVWERNGQSIFFSSRFTGQTGHINRTKSDGSGGVQTVLNSDDSVLVPGSICRNDQYLAYTGGRQSTAAIWILPLTGDKKPYSLLQFPVLGTSLGIGPRFSPDCKWIAYVSAATGRNEVYLTHFPDSTRIYQVSTNGGTFPKWRGDGKELFYYSIDDSSVQAVTVNENAGVVALDTPRTLFHHTNPVWLISSFDATPDGQRFLISTSNYSSGTTPLTLVMNWNADVKK